MHKNRSPCTTSLTGTLTQAAQLLESAGRLDVPATPERLSEPPADVLTPERAVARGLAVAGQVTEHVLLHEAAPLVGGFKLKQEKRGGESVTAVKMDVAYCDVINRNGRYYPRSCYEAANARAQADLADGGLWSLMDHPDYWEPVRGSLPNIVIKIEELGLDDREVEWPVGSGETRRLGVVWAKGILVETAKGLDAKALLKSGVKVGVSTNGWASTRWVRAADLDPTYYDPEELIPVTEDDFTYFSIDLVSDPSNLGGRARTERAAPPVAPAPAPTSPTKEGTMHELLLALMEQYPGLTLDQIKASHRQAYLETMAQIAEETQTSSGDPQSTEPTNAPAPQPTPVTAPSTPAAPPSAPAAPTAPTSAPAPAPTPVVDYSAPTVSMEAYRALESQVVRLRSETDTLRENLRNQTRDTIVYTMLEAAALPPSGTVQVDGAQDIDLDASFRMDLIAGARSARSDDAARDYVERKITERRAIVGNRQEGRRPDTAAGRQFEGLNRQVNPAPRLPTSQNASEDRMAEGYAPLAQAFREII